MFVTGMQGDGSSGFIKASACLKHYAAYNLETGRNSFPAMVTAQDMEDTYLPAFEAGVTKGNASGIM
jgi:beta-glucosidase